MRRAAGLAIAWGAVVLTGCASPERAATGGEAEPPAQVQANNVRSGQVEEDELDARPRPGGAAAPTTSPPRPEGGQRGWSQGWEETPHGGPGDEPTASGRCRLETPGRVEAQAPSRPLPPRPRLGLVVVREDGVLVHAPALLLELEGRLDGAVSRIVALGIHDAPTVGLADLARIGRARGLDLVLVDVKLAGERRRDGWLLAAATGEVVATFVDAEDEASIASPPQALELAARIERAWLALP